MESTCRDLRIVTGRRIRVSWLIFLCELCHLYDLRHQNCQPPLCGEVWGGGATECSAEVLVVSKGSLHMNVDRNSETASFQLRVVNIKIKMPYFPLNDPSRIHALQLVPRTFTNSTFVHPPPSLYKSKTWLLNRRKSRLLDFLIPMKITRARCVSRTLLQSGDLSQR